MIENVHRANLKPVEQAKAILEVFKASNLTLPSSVKIDGAGEGDIGGF